MAQNTSDQSECEYYRHLVEPLILALTNPNDRIRAAAWLRRLTETDTDSSIRKQHLELLIFSLQHQKLLGPFKHHPDNLQLVHLPDGFEVIDIAHEFYLAKQECIANTSNRPDSDGQPTVSDDISHKSMQFDDSQEIPAFGTNVRKDKRKLILSSPRSQLYAPFEIHINVTQDTNLDQGEETRRGEETEHHLATPHLQRLDRPSLAPKRLFAQPLPEPERSQNEVERHDHEMSPMSKARYQMRQLYGEDITPPFMGTDKLNVPIADSEEVDILEEANLSLRFRQQEQPGPSDGFDDIVYADDKGLFQEDDENIEEDLDADLYTDFVEELKEHWQEVHKERDNSPLAGRLVTTSPATLRTPTRNGQYEHSYPLFSEAMPEKVTPGESPKFKSIQQTRDAENVSAKLHDSPLTKEQSRLYDALRNDKTHVPIEADQHRETPSKYPAADLIDGKASVPYESPPLETIETVESPVSPPVEQQRWKTPEHLRIDKPQPMSPYSSIQYGSPSRKDYISYEEVPEGLFSPEKPPITPPNVPIENIRQESVDPFTKINQEHYSSLQNIQEEEEPFRDQVAAHEMLPYDRDRVIVRTGKRVSIVRRKSSTPTVADVMEEEVDNIRPVSSHQTQPSSYQAVDFAASYMPPSSAPQRALRYYLGPEAKPPAHTIPMKWYPTPKDQLADVDDPERQQILANTAEQARIVEKSPMSKARDQMRLLYGEEVPLPFVSSPTISPKLDSAAAEQYDNLLIAQPPDDFQYIDEIDEASDRYDFSGNVEEYMPEYGPFAFDEGHFIGLAHEEMPLGVQQRKVRESPERPRSPQQFEEAEFKEQISSLPQKLYTPKFHYVRRGYRGGPFVKAMPKPSTRFRPQMPIRELPVGHDDDELAAFNYQMEQEAHKYRMNELFHENKPSVSTIRPSRRYTKGKMLQTIAEEHDTLHTPIRRGLVKQRRRLDLDQQGTSQSSGSSSRRRGEEWMAHELPGQYTPHLSILDERIPDDSNLRSPIRPPIHVQDWRTPEQLRIPTPVSPPPENWISGLGFPQSIRAERSPDLISEDGMSNHEFEGFHRFPTRTMVGIRADIKKPISLQLHSPTHARQLEGVWDESYQEEQSIADESVPEMEDLSENDADDARYQQLAPQAPHISKDSPRTPPGQIVRTPQINPMKGKISPQAAVVEPAGNGLQKQLTLPNIEEEEEPFRYQLAAHEMLSYDRDKVIVHTGKRVSIVRRKSSTSTLADVTEEEEDNIRPVSSPETQPSSYHAIDFAASYMPPSSAPQRALRYYSGPEAKPPTHPIPMKWYPTPKDQLADVDDPQQQQILANTAEQARAVEKSPMSKARDQMRLLYGEEVPLPFVSSPTISPKLDSAAAEQYDNLLTAQAPDDFQYIDEIDEASDRYDFSGNVEEYMPEYGPFAFDEGNYIGLAHEDMPLGVQQRKVRESPERPHSPQQFDEAEFKEQISSLPQKLYTPKFHYIRRGYRGGPFIKAMPKPSTRFRPQMPIRELPAGHDDDDLAAFNYQMEQEAHRYNMNELFHENIPSVSTMRPSWRYIKVKKLQAIAEEHDMIHTPVRRGLVKQRRRLDLDQRDTPQLRGSPSRYQRITDNRNNIAQNLPKKRVGGREELSDQYTPHLSILDERIPADPKLRSPLRPPIHVQGWSTPQQLRIPTPVSPPPENWISGLGFPQSMRAERSPDLIGKDGMSKDAVSEFHRFANGTEVGIRYGRNKPMSLQTQPPLHPRQLEGVQDESYHGEESIEDGSVPEMVDVSENKFADNTRYQQLAPENPLMSAESPITHPITPPGQILRTSQMHPTPPHENYTSGPDSITITLQLPSPVHARQLDRVREESYQGEQSIADESVPEIEDLDEHQFADEARYQQLALQAPQMSTDSPRTPPGQILRTPQMNPIKGKISPQAAVVEPAGNGLQKQLTPKEPLTSAKSAITPSGQILRTPQMPPKEKIEPPLQRRAERIPRASRPPPFSAVSEEHEIQETPQRSPVKRPVLDFSASYMPRSSATQRARGYYSSPPSKQPETPIPLKWYPSPEMSPMSKARRQMEILYGERITPPFIREAEVSPMSKARLQMDSPRRSSMTKARESSTEDSPPKSPVGPIRRPSPNLESSPSTPEAQFIDVEYSARRQAETGAYFENRLPRPPPLKDLVQFDQVFDPDRFHLDWTTPLNRNGSPIGRRNLHQEYFYGENLTAESPPRLRSPPQSQNPSPILPREPPAMTQTTTSPEDRRETLEGEERGRAGRQGQCGCSRPRQSPGEGEPKRFEGNEREI